MKMQNKKFWDERFPSWVSDLICEKCGSHVHYKGMNESNTSDNVILMECDGVDKHQSAISIPISASTHYWRKLRGAI